MDWQVIRQPAACDGQWRYQVVHDGQEIGRCWVLVRPGESVMFSGLYVAPAWRGQGIARALLTRLLADCAACGVTCHAEPFGHTPGLARRSLLRFYRRHGARVTRTGLCTWPAHGEDHVKKAS